MRRKRIDPRFIAPLVVTAILALGAVPAAATIETYNIIFHPTIGAPPSGSITLDVTCVSCFLLVPTFDITDLPAEWTQADPNFLVATVIGGVVTDLDNSYGVIDSVPPGDIPPGDMFLGFDPGNAYHIAGSDPTVNNPYPPGPYGTYELQLATVPEPVSSGLLLAGVAGYGIMARWRKRRVSE